MESFTFTIEPTSIICTCENYVKNCIFSVGYLRTIIKNYLRNCQPDNHSSVNSLIDSELSHVSLSYPVSLFKLTLIPSFFTQTRFNTWLSLCDRLPNHVTKVITTINSLFLWRRCEIEEVSKRSPASSPSKNRKEREKKNHKRTTVRRE